MSAIEGSGVGNLDLAADEVHVWHIHLVAPEDMIHRWQNVLCQDELQRAGRSILNQTEVALSLPEQR